MYVFLSLIWFAILTAYMIFALFNFAVPIFYSFPLSIKFTIQRKTKPLFILNVLVAPIAWALITLGLIFAILFLAGYTQNEMFISVIFGSATDYGVLFGIVAFILSLVRKDTRSDIVNEFYPNKYVKFLTDRQMAHYNEFEYDMKSLDSDNLIRATQYNKLDYMEKFIIFCEIQEREKQSQE